MDSQVLLCNSRGCAFGRAQYIQLFLTPKQFEMILEGFSQGYSLADSSESDYEYEEELTSVLYEVRSNLISEYGKDFLKID